MHGQGREADELKAKVYNIASLVACPAGCSVKWVTIDLSRLNESPTSARLYNGCCEDYHNEKGQVLEGLVLLLH